MLRKWQIKSLSAKRKKEVRSRCPWIFRRCYTFVLLLAFIVCARTQEIEGDWCVTENGEDGICRHLRHCPSLMVKDYVYNGAGQNTPNLCSYGRSGAIVCCGTVRTSGSFSGAGAEGASLTGEPNSNPRFTLLAEDQDDTVVVSAPVDNRNVTDDKDLRISERKCREYMKSLEDDVQFRQLGPGDNSDKWCPQPPPVNRLIVGGVAANPGEYPHMASLGYLQDGKVSWLCGGSLISDTYVLTAAHCFKFSYTLVAVSLGALRVTEIPETIVRTRISDGTEFGIYPVADVIRHPQYTIFKNYHDIGLIRLGEPVKSFDMNLRPACLLAENSIVGIKKAMASGFGKTKDIDMSETRSLRHVELNVYSIEVCRRVFAGLTTLSKLSDGIVDSMVCAGELSGGRDSCQGDSGGPLQIRDPKDKCIFRIMGVTSFGTPGCGSPDTAALYTKVSHYLPWIEQVVWPQP